MASLLFVTGAAHASDALDKPLQAAARTVLEERARHAGLVDAQFTVALVKTARPVPPCTKPVDVESLDTRHPSRMRFAVTCVDETGWRQEVVVRASVSARVLVAAAALPANRPLSADDVSIERRDVSAVPDALSDPAAVVGMSSRRALHPGDVLRSTSLVAALLVRRGQAVRIVASNGPIEVTAAGEALDDGASNALVRVRNASTGKVIRARVSGLATVEPVGE